MPKVVPSPSDSNETKKPWYKTLEGWKIILEIIGIIFAIGYAIVTFLQWKDLRHNFEFDQRAWLKVQIKGPEAMDKSYSATPLVLPLVVANVGKSPALNIIAETVVEVDSADTSPSLKAIPGRSRCELQRMFPADSIDVCKVGLPHPEDVSGPPTTKLTDAQVQELITGKSYLVIFGQASYKDQFGAHWTRYCAWKGYVSDVMVNALPCVTWNGDGDGPPPK